MKKRIVDKNSLEQIINEIIEIKEKDELFYEKIESFLDGILFVSKKGSVIYE